MSAPPSGEPPPAPDPERRRGFLKVVTGALGSVIGAVAAVPGLAFLGHPLRRPTVTGGDQALRVAAADEVRSGLPLRADVVGDRRDGWLRQSRVKLGACWLVRAADGRIRAFSTICPHLGCGIDWNVDTNRFDCPCHGSVFDVEGHQTSGPSPRPMDELAVETSGDDVKVRYRRFRVATSKKEPIG